METLVDIARLSPMLQQRVLAELVTDEDLRKEDRLLTYREAARLYGLTYMTIRCYVSEGRLTPHYLNGHKGSPRLTHGEMRRMLAERRAGGRRSKAEVEKSKMID